MAKSNTVLNFPYEKNRYKTKSFRRSTFELQDSLRTIFEVSIGYWHYTYDDISIEWYELDGDNIDRKELIDRFGVTAIRAIELNIKEDRYSEIKDK